MYRIEVLEESIFPSRLYAAFLSVLLPQIYLLLLPFTMIVFNTPLITM
jgi:hypothetical protein